MQTAVSGEDFDSFQSESVQIKKIHSLIHLVAAHHYAS